MNFNQLSAFFLMAAALFSCKNQQNNANSPPVPEPAIVEVVQKNKKDSCRAEKWDYADFNLTIEGNPCNKQKIVFKSQIAKSNGHGGIAAMHDLASLVLINASSEKSPNEEYITEESEPVFKCNNQIFDGMLLGVIDNNGKEDTILEYIFVAGQLTGKAFLRSDDRKLHIFNTPSPTQYNRIPNQSIQEKPVIYLYPTRETSVNVRINFKGELTHTYPKYNPAQGWTVTAKPDGELRDEKTGKIYYNLFWEGKSSYKYDLSTGFVVKGEDVADFLDESLAKLGLNRREANEFITYWLPEMEQNKYNLVHFSTSEYLAQAPLEVSPKADTEIRVFMVYQPLDAPINIAPQTLESPARKGFTLVEWGGMMQKRAEN